jgi:uncharacterized protein YceH (UPF0502 family)
VIIRMNEPAIDSESKSKPPWQPLGPIDRRVVGVLVEKAKTTPDVYPLSLNALATGCNQKNNRDPVMQLSEDAVEESLTRLRSLGAVQEVQGSGRVSRFRHHMYEWLGVEKVELAVMAELFLRGAQTEGELRGRAARMEPIADVNALRPILGSLRQKGLVISLTSEGRGHVVSHALYPADELEKLRAQYESHESRETLAPARSSPMGQRASNEGEGLQSELAEIRAGLAQLRQEFDELNQNFHRTEEEVRQLKQALG